MELPGLYRQMLRSRHFEVAVEGLWQRGLISGEMHLGTGEEAVAAGVVTHLREGDGMALAHRCTPALVVRGVPLLSMLREMLGRSDGLCGGQGGHMHLMSRDHLAASSGIVGASLPLGAGFALAAKRTRPHAVAVAFTGDGALNQGAVLESLNLAVAWRLPLLVVCIDNGWAITTASGAVTGGSLLDRARAFGLHAQRVEGRDVEAVHHRAGELVSGLRRGAPPAFLLADCPRLDGHFLGDPLLRQAREPLAEGRETLKKVLSATLSQGGAGIAQRAGGLLSMVGTMARARLSTERDGRDDPLTRARRRLDPTAAQLSQIESEVEQEITGVVSQALADLEEACDA